MKKLILALFVFGILLPTFLFVPHSVFAFTGSISLSSNGGNCNLVGDWDIDTKTCTLNDDISGSITISGNDITLNGNNHTLKRGDIEYTGINVSDSFNVTIKNLIIEDFTNSIVFKYVSESTVQNVNLTSSGIYGLQIKGGQNNKFLDSTINNVTVGFSTDSGGHTISGNTFINNRIEGIELFYQAAKNILIENNLIDGSDSSYGIYSVYAENNIIKGNTIKNNAEPGYYAFSFRTNSGTVIVQNNFINNGWKLNRGQTSQSVYATLSQDLPIGGNYWSDFDSPSKGCNDLNEDGICDLPRIINYYDKDLLPWTKENGWKAEIILEKAITSFSFKSLTPNVNGIIDEVNHAVTLNVPFGTDVKTLAPTITISSGTFISPNNNTPQDFSNPVTYTVTATDMSTQTYTVTVVVDKPIHNPVILIPGITGSYLYKDYGDKEEIWPDPTKVILSIRDLFLKDLSLEIDGKENIEKPIVIGDIIRGIPSLGIHVFDRLISELIDNGGYVEGTDLFVFPYDWRISTSQNAVLLKEKIDKVLLNTGYENVDIIAHSMGGLIAKKYIADNGQEKIDQLIFLGTPQLGAPKAFKALMFGDSMGYEKFSIPLLRPSIAKFISQNMPSVYELLPSEKYIENNGSYVTDASNEIIDLSSFDLNYLETKNLMVEKGRNPLMFPFAEDLHNSIDNLDLSGIETHNFVGCGTKTIGGITVKQKLSWASFGFRLEDDFDLKYVNGDETVPLESANKAIGAHIYFANGDTHGSLPSAEGVRQDVLSILKGEELQNYPNILTDASTCNISGKVVSTHSPVELHIYDEAPIPNHTGPNSDGDIEYNVAGVQYDIIDGEKFAFLPDGVNYKIVTKATDTGGYNFQIKDQNKNDEVTATYDWNLIPLETLQAKGEISVGPDYPASEYEVTMDNNGDNVPDTTISSNIPVDFKFYLNVLRKAVGLLGLEQKTEKALLNKIDKVEKEYDKGKEEKTSDKLTKLLEKVNNGNGQLKDISLTKKSIIVNSINTLLDILK